MDSPSSPEEQGLRDYSTSPLALFEESGRGGRSRAADRVMRKADESTRRHSARRQGQVLYVTRRPPRRHLEEDLDPELKKTLIQSSKSC